jgi:hypothetical protein
MQHISAPFEDAIDKENQETYGQIYVLAIFSDTLLFRIFEYCRKEGFNREEIDQLAAHPDYRDVVPRHGANKFRGKGHLIYSILFLSLIDLSNIKGDRYEGCTHSHNN